MCRSVCVLRQMFLFVLASDTKRLPTKFLRAGPNLIPSEYSLSPPFICGCLQGFPFLLKYTDLFWCFSVQGCAATCCVHLSGSNHLHLEREWALPTSGARAGSTVLRGWTDPEVTGTILHTYTGYTVYIYIFNFNVSVFLCGPDMSLLILPFE